VSVETQTFWTRLDAVVAVWIVDEVVKLVERHVRQGDARRRAEAGGGGGAISLAAIAIYPAASAMSVVQSRCGVSEKVFGFSSQAVRYRRRASMPRAHLSASSLGRYTPNRGRRYRLRLSLTLTAAAEGRLRHETCGFFVE
jgi:hypothetical protein